MYERNIIWYSIIRILILNLNIINNTINLISNIILIFEYYEREFCRSYIYKCYNLSVNEKQ